MESRTAGALDLFDIYGMVYAFTALLLIPGLFAIEQLSIVTFSPLYLLLIAAPFFVGPAIVFGFESSGGLREFLLRAVVLAPLAALSAVMIVFGLMMVIMVPLSMLLNPSNFDALGLLFASIVVVMAMPVVLSLWRRIREGLSVAGLVKIVVLLAAIAVVGWMIVMTFSTGNTLGTFLRKDVVEHFIGAFTWYLPALALSAAIWLRLGIV